MEAVSVLTIQGAAKRLDTSHYSAQRMLMRGELTQASVDGRPAVLEDALFRKAERKLRKAVAA